VDYKARIQIRGGAAITHDSQATTIGAALTRRGGLLWSRVIPHVNLDFEH
jgi:hypothetical protein